MIRAISLFSAKATPHRRRRQWLIGIAAIVALTAVTTGAGVLVGHRMKSPSQLAAEAKAPSPSRITAKVELRKLSEPIIIRGSLKQGESTKIYLPVGDTAGIRIVTKVMVSAGSKVTEGQALLEINGTPLIGMCLSFALYRDITPGAEGPDVTQIQLSLKRLGYATSTNGVFDEASQQAWRSFMKTRGYTVKPTQVTGGEQPASTPGAQAPARSSDGVTIDKKSIVVLDRSGHTVTGIPVAVGSVIADSKQPLVEFNGRPHYLESLVTRDQVSLLQVGQHADVIDEAAGKTVSATVSEVGSSPVSGTNNPGTNNPGANNPGANNPGGGGTGYPVKFTFVDTIPPPTDRSFRVAVTGANATAEVLAVPISAISSRTDGSTFVDMVSSTGEVTEVTIHPGQSLGGWTEIKSQQPSVLTAGSVVVVGVNLRKPAGTT